MTNILESNKKKERKGKERKIDFELKLIEKKK